ncbi:MAG TPA: dephospho-CoA kinase [Haloplasmataceae bacterium]
MSLIVGLTGGIASGKSTVSEMFRNADIPVIDNDVIARIVVQKDNEAYKKIVQEFGREILQDDGEIDRKKLSSIVFFDKVRLQKLNDIVHPEVKKVVINDIEYYTNMGHKIIVLDVPLLFESHFDELCDFTVVVYTDKETQYQRLMKRNNYSYLEAKMRIESQFSLEKKKQLANFVIDNSKTLEETKRQFSKLLEILKTYI